MRLRLILGSLLLSLLASVLPAEEPISPQGEVIKLFNGKNLDNWYVWLKDTKYEDPRQVFTVRDGMLHISGDGLGGLTTNKEYRNYRLVTEWKWGPRTWANREKATKDSGILVHGIGPDGGYGGIWLCSFEAQVIEGGCGDFIVVAGKLEDGTAAPLKLTANVVQDRDGEYVWSKDGMPREFTGGRVNWFGRDPDWKDELGFRGKQDVEKPDGEWNRMEVICQGDRITNIVNGVVVNQAYNVSPAAGKIQIQSELAEIIFRKIELHPLDDDAKTEDQQGFKPLFDGKSLDGWTQRNGTATYRVEDGMVVGKTNEGSPNSFLCTDKKYGDFELTFEVLVADELNSGVQIRSQSIAEKDNGRVHGPQVEISTDGMAGYIYGEALGTGWLSPDPQPHKHFKNGKWNQYRVRAEGKSIKTWLNGQPVADFMDEKSEMSEGFIGLQVHSIAAGTGPYEVRWRNIQIKELK